MYERKPESVIVDEIFTEESESESVHKSININKEKDAIDETQDEEYLATHNPVINKPIYFNLFEWGKNILKNIDATCKQACMETSRARYYTETFRTLTD